MKKFLRLICLGFVFVFICTGMSLMRRFPVDTQPYVEKKYAGWNGVLQAWICTRWSPNGSFVHWLNRCAADFEKEHEGVYLEFTPVQVETMRKMNTNALPLPDLIFFSPGVITNPDMLASIHTPDSIRNELWNYGQGFASPVALGGYIWAYNTALCDDIPRSSDIPFTPILPQDTDGQSFSAALLGLLSSAADEDDAEYILPETGIDLGLPVSATNKSLYAADALDLFIDGALPYIPVDTKMLARLQRLSDAGKGPEWQAAVSGEITCTDQILLAAVPQREAAPERKALAEEFISTLLQAEAQDTLADIGAFSVTGKNIHSGFSVYAEMDALLNSRPLWLPACFSEYSVSDNEAIVRRFLEGEISAKNALGLLGFAGM